MPWKRLPRQIWEVTPGWRRQSSGSGIGGFDQFHFFTDCTEEETRQEVRRCFREAGKGGGYILAPSDHFFEADLNLLEAFADEARNCTY
jgi:hypothetical protein